MKNLLFWNMTERGKRWIVQNNVDGPTLGVVSHNFDGWCGIICLSGKKWPEGQKSIYGVDCKFWSVRRAVEDAIVKLNSPTTPEAEQ